MTRYISSFIYLTTINISEAPAWVNAIVVDNLNKVRDKYM